MAPPKSTRVRKRWLLAGLLAGAAVGAAAGYVAFGGLGPPDPETYGWRWVGLELGILYGVPSGLLLGILAMGFERLLFGAWAFPAALAASTQVLPFFAGIEVAHMRHAFFLGALGWAAFAGTLMSGVRREVQVVQNLPVRALVAAWVVWSVAVALYMRPPPAF